jgi:hypothetical protein
MAERKAQTTVESAARQAARMPPQTAQTAALRRSPAPQIGNQAMGRLLAPVIQRRCAACEEEQKAAQVQTKLTIGAAGDSYEQEADRVAEQVTRKTEEDETTAVAAQPRISRRATPASTLASAEPVAEPGLEARLQNESLGGRSLEPTVQRRMESRFGIGFDRVRVHTDGSAQHMAKEINAQAFTYGHHIYFSQGAYDPGREAGDRLLAHELTHVVQQRGADGGAVQRRALPGPAARTVPSVRLPMDGPTNPNEKSADAAAGPSGGVAADSPTGGRGGNGEAAASDDSVDLPHSLADAILCPAGGAPLPAGLRRDSERRLGAALSHVRVHQGTQADTLAEALGARAFTYGSNVWLGAGETLADRSLITHELAHVVQQSPRPLDDVAEPDRLEAPTRIQAVRREYYNLPRLGKGIRGPGDRTHDYVQEILGKEPKNDGLFSEAPIPGGALTGADGRADLIKTDTLNYFGVTFAGAEPKYLPLLSKTLRNGAEASNAAHALTAAPAGNAGGGACKGSPLPSKWGICRMDRGPKEIEIADIKPNYDAETLLGGGQVSRYIGAITALSNKVNAFAASSPGMIDPPGHSWAPTPQTMSKIEIPAAFKTPTPSSKQVQVSLFIDDVQTRITELAVLKIAQHSAGIITYEYIPTYMLGSGVAGGGGGAGTGAASPIGNAKAKLAPVKEKLKKAPERKKAAERVGKLRRTAGPVQRPRLRLALQREALDAKDDFDFGKWKTDDFLPWQKAAETATGGEGKKALTDPSAEAEKRLKDEAVRQIAARNQGNFKTAPAGTLENTRELEQVQHWIDHGQTYGRLRQIFGSIFVKVMKVYDSVKANIEKKVAAARARMARKTGGSGGIKGAVLKALRTIAGTLLGVFIRDVGNRLATALHKGATALINKYFGEELEEAQEQLERIQQAEEAVKKSIAETLEEKLGLQMKDLDEKIKLVEEVAETVREIGTIVNVVKWAYRIAQCGAPPLLGCILAFVGSTIAEAIIAAIVASCWFQREVAYPVVKALEPIRRLPALVAKAIADRVRELLPVPIKPLMGEVEVEDLSSSPNDIDCDSGSKYNLDPGQRKMAEMLEQYDPEHVEALMAALQHLGVDSQTPDPNTKVTDADIARVKALLDKYSKEKLQEIVKNTPPRPPRAGATKDFMDDLEAVADAPQTGGTPETSDPQREGAQAARLLKQATVPRGSEGFAPGDHQVGETFYVFYLKNFGQLIGGYQKMTVKARDDDKKITVQLHAGTRFYDADGKLVETSTRAGIDTYDIHGEGPNKITGTGGKGEKK